METFGNDRTKTRHTGVYYKKRADGSRAYQIAWKVDGKLHWKTIPGGERDAVAARAEIVAQLARGKKVAPSRETFASFADAWLESQLGRVGERTYDEYQRAVNYHLKPEFGRQRLTAITEERVAAFIRKKQEKGYAGWTIRGMLVPFGRIMAQAVRKGHVGENPVRGLERHERPRVEKREQRILDKDEIGRLLDHAAGYRPVLATAILTGARQQEILGLHWGDVDFEAAVIRIRAQLSRKTAQRKPLKTAAAERDIVLTQTLAQILREHRLASPHSRDADFVFATATGKPLSPSNVVKRGLHKACERAQLRGPRPRFHDLRHSFASLMISQGADPAFVARQLGHSSPNITLSVYAHLFDGVRHANRFRDLLDSALSPVVLGNSRVTTDGSERKSPERELAEVRRFGRQR